MDMNLSALATDNVTELLIKVLQFTNWRHRVLTENVINIHTPGFVPKDLMVEEFAELMDDAIDEHKRNNRLMLRDTESIRFGANGAFEVEPVVDEYAEQLFENNIARYVELQMRRLLENSLNHGIATELLKQKQEAAVL